MARTSAQEVASRQLGRRPIVAADLAFLEGLYATTRDDIARLPLGAAQRQNLLAMQFSAQHEHYRRRFPRAEFDVILWRGEPVGRLYVDRSGDEVRLIDIALLPAWRGRGLGTTVVEELLAEAAEAGQPVRLRVEPGNPAVRLYRRLGFETIADEQVNLHMEWTPREGST